MAPPLRVTLDQAAHDELERRYQTTRDATTRTRYQMILLRAEGHPVVEVAHLTRCSPDTVRRVLKRYLAGGPDAVPHRPHLGQPPHYPPAWQAELVRVADLDPRSLGVDSALWTCRLLADYLAEVTGHRAGIETVRLALHRGRVGVQAAPLGADSQGAGPAGVGKKRVRVEALLAAAASPLPPPAADLVPDATLADGLFPDDLPRLLGLLGRVDLYLQDEVEVALHPTLTRVWSRAGRRGQRLVQAPGTNAKQYGFGLVDWRDGYLDFALADGRRAAPLCAQLRRAVARSRSRGRVAMVILDNLGIHTPKGSRLLRGLLEELGEQLVLVYTPTYDPDANRIEWLWRSLRRTVTHTHQRQSLADLVADADRWARTTTPAQVLSQIGSPFAADQQPPVGNELDHAA
jgi:transposase